MVSWPTNTKEVTDSIRDAIGRTVIIHTHSDVSLCPDCKLDPISGKSSDPFCSTCGGTGYITSKIDSEVTAHINWNSIGDTINTPGGRIFNGDCKISIEYTSVNLSNVMNADYFTVDNKNLYLKNYDIRGVPTPNRIIIILVEDPREVD